MGKKQIKKVTLEQLIARKIQGDLDKLKVKYYDSKELGGQIEIRKIPLFRVLEMMDELDDNSKATESVEFNCQLIFECCPMFNTNAKKLCEVYECEDPLRLPVAIFNDNMGELNDLGEEILKMYGLDDANDKIKN